MKKIRFVETVLRDGQQSLIATRMKTEQMTPILSKMDKCGYHAMEVWGGATFDSCLRYLNEDPWERLRVIRRNVKDTKLQMLLRGQNILGYKNYSDDVVDLFVKRAIENGIDIVRIFDALNDVRNLERAAYATKKYGGECQLTMSYTKSPVHTLDYFVTLGKQLVDMGADSLCIKDMAGILMPQEAFDLVSALKSEIDLPIDLHTHATSGISEMMYLKAAEAGVDYIDTAISPFAGGTSQPPTECLHLALNNAGFDTGLDTEKLVEVADYFKPVRDEFRQNGILDAKVQDVEPKTLKYKVPGGMLSNLLSQLKQQHLEEKFEATLEEVPRVREDLGFPPLVTPLSQMVGIQAVMNVITGEPYKVVPTEIKEYVEGYYGQPPAPIDAEVAKKIIHDISPITCRPADLLSPQVPALREEIGNLAKNEDDLLIYALFPAIGKEYLERKNIDFFDIPFDPIEMSLT
ncbi:oxaloacetate decarboxylase, alpha subunit [Pilibacter termitis]|uniref:Oxaloacetate decarboxylase, alpha subunit n=1 Tax=Pilibacter termitis TaxID=263852 RepID=A0A1T4QIX5_9ENTE|nr:oxaloacetate decarboxylase subunit alpha [Pilibacter termitis]SKA03743.1 oxaloacetate decarboxylase, alpha subunit [Pilibacter termitis]